MYKYKCIQEVNVAVNNKTMYKNEKYNVKHTVYKMVQNDTCIFLGDGDTLIETCCEALYN